MNVICILCDTLRPDHLDCYGNPTVRTPNFDRLSRMGVTFENACLNTFPVGARHAAPCGFRADRRRANLVFAPAVKG